MAPKATFRITNHLLRSTMAIGLVLVLMALFGCASLPAPAPNPVSTALPVDTASELGRVAAASLTEAPAGQSGFRLLADGDHALHARLTLVRHAERSIDAQYYVVASDDVGLLFLRELRDAALRGVRVRLLVDDLHTAEQDPLFSALAAHPNVEVRLFNPLPARQGAVANRVVASLHQFSRVNRRMHNKLLVADNAMAVTGGRNIANEYFMRGASANFIDMDVLATGPVVQQLSAVFDAYWNSDVVWPVERIAVPVHGSAEAAQAYFAAQVETLPTLPPVVRPDRFGAEPLQLELARGRVLQTAANARVLADAPAKANGPVEHTTQQQALDTMRGARGDLLIVSPYFVPGTEGMALLADAAQRQVHTTVMTNSLGATDEPLVHSGYARYRQAMLKMGVRVLEVGSTLTRQSGGFGDFRSSLGRLHAKLAVVDHRHVFVGSMNMDGRSARYNTEMGLVIDSEALAARVHAMVQRDGESSTYRLQLAEGSERIEWHATDDGRPVVHAAEPDSTWFQRVKLSVLSSFVAEDLL
jgi:putative cardiolipin synthase